MTHYWVSDAWPLVTCLTLALLATSYLAWHNGREAAAYRSQRNLAIDDGKYAYARGHEDGLAEGYAKGKSNTETAFRKADYDKGYHEGYTAGWRETLEIVSEADAERQRQAIAA